MNLTIDFETRSQADLTLGGSRKYAESPTTQVMCLAILVDGKTKYLHIPYWVLQLHPGIYKDFPYITLPQVYGLIEQADTIEAHNASFEMDIWNNCYPRTPKLSLEKMHCSAAKSAMHALPRALGHACEAINSPQQKDSFGAAVMRKMCKPRKALKTDKERDPDWEVITYWHESREEFETLFRYCLQDVVSEHSFSSILRDLPASERAVWLLDQTINERGIEVSLPNVTRLLEMVSQNELQMNTEFSEIVQGECSPKQVAKVLEILASRGVDIPDLQKGTVTEYLAGHAGEMDPAAERIMEIRLGTAKSSTAKFKAFVNTACADSRARGLLLYHGADTGRWAGQKIQPQNLPSRGILKPKLIDRMFETLEETTDPDVIEMMYGPPLWCASSAIRACFQAPKGKDLICADYSAIEGRVLAWLAGEQYVVDAYRNGVDTYVLAAAGIYHCGLNEVTPEQRQIGKVVELACGYQGGANAFLKMAEGYRVHVPEEDAKRIVAEWRNARPETKRYWAELEKAAKLAIKTPGQQVRYRNVSFKCGNIAISGTPREFLCCRLPSGRMLHYPFPKLIMKTVPWSKGPKETISFWGVDSLTKRWVRQDTYGGKISENITQATSRDILAEAMLRLEATGKYPIVLHVHDEIVSEVTEGQGDLEEYCGIMKELPAWADGLPIDAHGWIGKRYQK